MTQTVPSGGIVHTDEHASATETSIPPAPPSDPGDTLFYEAIAALGELRDEIDEVDALILAAALAVQRAPGVDEPEGRRALRHTIYLVECAQKRAEVLQRKTYRVATDILARWKAREGHRH